MNNFYFRLRKYSSTNHTRKSRDARVRNPRNSIDFGIFVEYRWNISKSSSRCIFPVISCMAELYRNHVKLVLLLPGHCVAAYAQIVATAVTMKSEWRRKNFG